MLVQFRDDLTEFAAESAVNNGEAPGVLESADLKNLLIQHGFFQQNLFNAFEPVELGLVEME